MTAGRSIFGYYIGVVVLGVLILGAVVLVGAMIARPGPPPASVLTVTDRAPVPCPDHHKRATCFETQVTNNGTARTSVRCQVHSTDGAQATFFSSATTTQILLDTDQSVHLDSIVVTSDDAAAAPPDVECQPVEAP